MAGLEELKKKLAPLFDAEKGFSGGSTLNSSDSYMLSDGGSGTVNLLSRSYGVYNINELGLQKCTSWPVDETDHCERTYRCASHEMRIFGAIGSGASSVVQRAIHIPTHRILALKKINIFEKEKRQQLLTEIRMLCEAPCYQGLVDFHGAFYTPDSGQISIALEYMDGGSLADIIRVRKYIPEPVLSLMAQKVLHGLSYLHGVRHLVHRDIKPANLLVNLKGESKITDFGISAGLENSMAMCATFVGTVTYMSPERIRNESYSYPADIWSLGLALFECGTGEFPYAANEGPVNLMLQILDDPSPSPSKDMFSPEFCSFIDACLQKNADARPTAEQLLLHPFITKYEQTGVELAAFVQSVFDPTQRMKDLVDMLTIHYYQLFDGPDELWQHAETLYNEGSTFSFSGKQSVGPNDIFTNLSHLRNTLAGDWPPERLVHVVEKLQCRAHGQDGVAIRVSGSFIIGNQFLICGEGLQAEGLPNFKDLSIDISSERMGTFQEQFVMEPGNVIGRYYIAKQELYIIQK
ncbi:mitogen-activated protein kinase kinase 3 [Malania oleifera]|uniref:mitogen-activated protein kinase kinase 3 n=1 Tax=Malania oleifera TaxID=397392 RepID=UPI0025ADC148|nr:mitogen-activated protein kinase kinase 3 [Malania oleifera]XP_057983672.1 mitogen-activated protein kinase kinase 3 [Malania oleifera]XP_057983673.1 mitogen-activated protein kinase kinase 3 [Malania oleifera]XP_057983674.1 mitogen-activated protein kinase kinase 3 [Malania oleifera]XP_057983676.1 mitogen-activated protein kinase kinase 3 [Malania oleifera]XP_057983677.1 mitogen-activated protein kinase kinase 3 [Malania oleifera]XP_057983678.1 mitogen-activated protein kinase kinase 3 [M